MLNCSSIGVSSNQFLALRDFYLSTNGENWNWKNFSFGIPWNFTQLSNPLSIVDLLRPCGSVWQNLSKWQGLTCGWISSESTCGILGLSLVEYGLKGTIPTSIGELTTLTYLNVDSNKLSGTIPWEVGKLTQLYYFEIPNNQFYSSFPLCLFNLPNLFELHLESNYFFGTIPLGFGSFRILYLVSLVDNMFIGPLPSDIGNSTLIQAIMFSDNFLTGEIPTTLGLLTILNYFGIISNSFSGTIPNELLGVETLTGLELSSNFLVGTISSMIGSLPNLGSLGFSSNFLTSSFPDLNWQNFKEISNMDFSINYLSGEIPSKIGLTGSNLLELFLHNNLFSGSMPSEVAQLTHLSSLEISYNFFTGFLPNAFENMKELTFFELNNNFFSGTLPAGLLRSNRLYSLFLQHNCFSGPLVFPPPNQSPLILTNFITFDNQFTGPVPPQLFSLPLIEVVSLSLNCFSGPLPPCSPSSTRSITSGYSPTLRALDLSDLSSGPGCRHYPFSFLPHSGFLSTRSLTGSFPSCMLDLPNLNSLYLAGNGFKGQIQMSPQWSCQTSSLKNLILAENQLTGPIPSALQTCRSVSYLDLSLNRLSGTLDSGLATDSQSSSSFFGVSVNRLSGRLPVNSNLTSGGVGALVSNVLQGNMFSFSQGALDHSLSSSSPQVSLLTNGSSNLNTSLIFSLALICLCYFSYLFSNYYKHQNKNNPHILSLFLSSLPFTALSSQPAEDSDFIIEWVRTNPTVLHAGLCLVLVSLLLIVMKEAPLLAEQFSTQSYQYAWVLSASFLHGWLPCVLLGVSVGSVLVVVHWEGTTGLKIRKKTSSKQTTTVSAFLSLTILIVFDVGFMFFLNGLYLTVLLPLNSNLSLFQLLLGVAKTIWNSILSIISMNKFPSPGHCLSFGIFFRVFNMLIVTYLTGVLTESSCLYPLFVGHQINSFSFSATFCKTQSLLIKNNQSSIVCLKLGELPFILPPTNPPFIYHFQCASSLIVNYVPVMLYSLLSSLIWNCFQILVVLMCERLKLNVAHLPVVLFPTLRIISVSTLIHLMVNLTLLLTFGLACPYLGFMLIFSSNLHLFIYRFFSKLHTQIQETSILRESFELIDLPQVSHLSGIRETNYHPEHTPVRIVGSSETLHPTKTQPFLDDLSDAFHSILPTYLWIISFVVGGFWSLQFFDMVGDVYGVNSGLGASVCFFISIILLTFFIHLPTFKFLSYIIPCEFL